MVSGKAVAQGVEGDPLVDPRQLGGHMANAVQLTRGHRVDGVLARKQPRSGPADAPSLPQNIEQRGRKHGMAILAALALLDPKYHAGAVDVRDPQ
jgi:hypothetical protein